MAFGTEAMDICQLLGLEDFMIAGSCRDVKYRSNTGVFDTFFECIHERTNTDFNFDPLLGTWVDETQYHSQLRAIATRQDQEFFKHYFTLKK